MKKEYINIYKHRKLYRNMILELAEMGKEESCYSISKMFGVPYSSMKVILDEMIEEGLIHLESNVKDFRHRYLIRKGRAKNE